MSKQYSQKIVVVDSTFKNNGTPNAFSVKLDMANPNTFNRMSMVSGQLIKSWSTIDLENNTFTFYEETGVPNVYQSAVLTIEVGDYIPDSLPITLTNSLPLTMASLMTIQSAIGGWAGATYTGEYVPLTGKIAFLSSLTPKFKLEIPAYANGRNPLVNYLGFNTAGNQEVSVGAQIDMPRRVYFERYGVVQLRCTNTSNNNDNVLWNFLPTVSSGDSIYVENSDLIGNSVVYNNQNTNDLFFSITDSLGKSIPMTTDSQFIITFWDDRVSISK